jgi:hypothetical protein
MPFPATVIPVMIASPGDVTEYRTVTRNVLHEWNYIHSQPTGVILMPVGWESHSSPELGSTAQDLINDRVLEDCDLLVGIFWTRLGTPTGRASSGSVEEIQRHVEAGKPAMVYFSEAPVVMQTVDMTQFSALQQFRKWCQSRGLVESFFNAEDFQSKFRRHLQIALQKNPYLQLAFAAGRRATVPVEGAAALPVDELGTIAATLSPEARSLLLAAAEATNGTILAVDVLAGRMIQAGGKQFGKMDDRRDMAKWDYGLEQLSTLGLVERVSSGGKGDKIFQVVQRGYNVCDVLRK